MPLTLGAKFARPRVQLWVWGVFTLIWVVLMPIAEFTLLGISLRWIVFQSSFANVASCGTAWVAAMAYLRAHDAHDAAERAAADAKEARDHLVGQ